MPGNRWKLSRWQALPGKVRLMAGVTAMWLLIGVANAADATYLTLKAVLAQQLIEETD